MNLLDKHLARCAQQCDRLDADHWRLALTNGRLLPVSARLDDGFLLLDADTGLIPALEDLVCLTKRVSEFPAAVKLAARRGWPTVRLRAEFPLPEETDASAERIREHLGELQTAMHHLHDESSCETVGEAITGSLVELLKESGWPYHERPGGELLADLETGSQFLQAEIANYGAGVRFRVTLYRSNAADALTQQTLCLYLLEANAALRYAKAFLRPSDEETAAGFEVCIPGEPSTAEVIHALSALSVAGRQCARELKVLDGAMAGMYRSTRPPFYRSKGA